MLKKCLQQYKTRRSFLSLLGTTFSYSTFSRCAHLSAISQVTHDFTNAATAGKVVERLLPKHAGQIHLKALPQMTKEMFRISDSAGNIQIEGTTQSSLLMGVGWYLKYVAEVSISWNGDSLNRLPLKLPVPSFPITRSANVQHRFALNDTNDGYTGPYWSWEQWERQIDILALHGINEVLVYTGAEAVYQQTFRRFQLSDQELRNWLPTPAHQPWWLLENMSSWVGPSTSQQLIDARLALARKITVRLRESGMTPVLPGYFGIVPDGFAARNAGAHIIPQGKWLGIKRPDWLDPTCDLFPKVASEYYRTQETLLGSGTMFKMDPLHEGGEVGNVDITSAARAIDKQLQKAHPDAIWVLLGWQNNPRQECLAGISNKSHALILDGQSDRYAYRDRDQQWNDTPYAFGTIWNFGGHTTMGANVGVWNERYFYQLAKPGSKLNGIAIMPEASCNNPAAFEFFAEMAWRSQRPELSCWFAEWSTYRYGGQDPNASCAWDILRTTAYNLKSGKWSEAHDNLFSARPSLTAKSACTWSPQSARYDLKAFSLSLGSLLKVHPSLRNSSAYRYDLVDVARQTIANNSRLLLPKINAAYSAGDLTHFRELTLQWLKQIDLLNRIAAMEPSLLLGPWLASAKAAAANSKEEAQLEFDASSLLLEWGPEASRESGVHDYANREWNGLLEYYRERWAIYFSMLDASIERREPVKAVDWFATDQNWAKRTKQYPIQPQENFYESIEKIYRSEIMEI